MDSIEGISLIIILATIIISYQGFRDESFFEKYLFEVDAILINKEYIRLLSSGFLHGSWWHLIFNMAALYSFSFGTGHVLGLKNFVLLYFTSLIAGNILALLIHRNHGDYRAIGASGAVSGVIFSSIVMFPEADISFAFLPFHIKGWMFGIGYVLMAIYGIKTQFGNIGHEAHLGGAIAGILISIGMEPLILKMHPVVVTSILLPFVAFITLLVKKPEVLLIENYWGYQNKSQRNHNDYYASSYYDEELLNRLLEKVGEKGIDGLTKREKKMLEDLSKNIEK
jgi:membrane associated rhomboid family serine protease